LGPIDSTAVVAMNPIRSHVERRRLAVQANRTRTRRRMGPRYAAPACPTKFFVTVPNVSPPSQVPGGGTTKLNRSDESCTGRRIDTDGACRTASYRYGLTTTRTAP